MSCQSEVESDGCDKQQSCKRVDNKEFVDFITKNDDNTIKIVRHKITDSYDIASILSKHFDKIDTLICLDFHGVTDLYKPDEPIPSKLPKCIISYIGSKMETLQNTIDNITPRILSNEIILGIIVYTKNREPICGTKGWMLSLISTNVRKIHFIDDDMANIQSADNIKNKAIKTYFINKAPSDAKLQKLKPNQRRPLPRQAIDEILNKI